mgnify:CR=1 FL=1
MEVLVPDIGDFEEVDVIEILVSKGDHVSLETPLLTLESEKATMDIPAPITGKINEVLVNVGDKVSKGDKIFEIEDAERQQAPSSESNDHHIEERDKNDPSRKVIGNTIEVRVPDIGDFDEVDIIDILVSEGKPIDIEEPLVTLESDKATMDLPSPKKGVINKICVLLGDKVGEGDLIAIISVRDEQPTASPHQIPDVSPATQKFEPDEVKEGSTGKERRPTSQNASIIVHASPSVRKFARELGVEIGQIRGSGKKSRILHEDVQNYVKTQMRTKAEGDKIFFKLTEPTEIDYSQFGETERIELTKIQKLTGQNLHRSWITAPHVFQMDEADITELERFRRSKLDEIDDKKIKLTLLAFIVKACANTLNRFPRFNSSLNRDGASLTQKKYINIGIAVNTSKGLIVPVIRNVEKKGVIEIACEIQELAGKARDNKISPKELQGGTFTISNLGSLSGTSFTPVINVPEVAILGVSPSRMSPVWDNGTFVPRLMLPITLSYDHRVIDGVAGAQFTSYFTEILGDIRQALM